MLGFSVGGYFTMYMLNIPFYSSTKISIVLVLTSIIKLFYERNFEN